MQCEIEAVSSSLRKVQQVVFSLFVGKQMKFSTGLMTITSLYQFIDREQTPRCHRWFLVYILMESLVVSFHFISKIQCSGLN